jgi:HK97 gp10 family phage protein
VVPVSEYDEYAADLNRAADSIDADAERAVDRVERGALQTAQDNAPVLTGTLRRSLRTRRTGLAFTLESSVDYSVYVEYGTSDTAPQPFVAPAVDEWEPRLVRELELVRDRAVGGL